MSQPRHAILLHAELRGSAAQFSEIEDDLAGRPVERRFNRIERAVSAYRGTVVEDYWMRQTISFDSADAAVLAAREMQQRCSVLPQVSANRLALCIGIRQEFLQERVSDFSGSALEEESELTTLDDGILISEDVFQDINDELKKFAQPVDPSSLKRCYRLDWHLEIPSAAYACLKLESDTAFARPPGTLMLLHLGLKTVSLSLQMPVVTIGRSPENDLVLTDDCVSRRHCRIEAHPDGVMLVDVSTNGTSVLNNQGEEVLVRQKQFMLHGAGMLFFGRMCMGERRGSIRFESC